MRTLSELLALLPRMDADGNYFELRKQERGILGGEAAVEWTCALVNIHTGAETYNNIGKTPEEATIKMCARIGIDTREPLGVCMDACETAYIRLLQLPADSFRFDRRTQDALGHLRDALALTKNLRRQTAQEEYEEIALRGLRDDERKKGKVAHDKAGE